MHLKILIVKFIQVLYICIQCVCKHLLKSWVQFVSQLTQAKAVTSLVSTSYRSDPSTQIQIGCLCILNIVFLYKKHAGGVAVCSQWGHLLCFHGLWKMFTLKHTI